ncbi:MAG: DNA polymerase III subunit beta [Oscillospiraceae bacterium]|jgi:DNA polymerase-3 subunit beta|nr:DNA polymerase III subunit beta [Oscillospiraceae bacterium]
MDFTCFTQRLTAACIIAQRAAAQKSAEAALTGLLLRADAQDTITVTGYDLKIGIQTKFSEGVSVNVPGDCVVPGRLFCDIVRRLEGETVRVRLGTNGSVTIESGESEFTLQTIPGEYPDFPSVDDTESVGIAAVDFVRLIESTSFAVATVETRVDLTGGQFTVSPNRLRVVFCDGYKLAMCQAPAKTSGAFSGSPFIVPGIALAEAKNIASVIKPDERIKIGVSEASRHVVFNFPDTVLISRRLTGDFVNFDTVVPQDNNKVVIADRRKLLATTERVSLVSQDKLKSPLRVTINPETEKIFMRMETAVGEAEDTAPIAAIAGAELREFAINNRYLLDALRACSENTVRLTYSENVKPIAILPEEQDDDSFLYLIVPMRFSAQNKGE